VDPFAIGVLAAVAIAVAAAVLAGLANRRKPLSEFGARPRRPSTDALETEDLQQMLDATNARRRARGLPERSLGDAIREFGDE
jgi:hypothetical protein